ncbi:putative metal-nicotianamine transporter YSL7 [Zea mays]|uniref:Putative metal-nicotianamine transporter YSL7 n=1 Tax=Zea mays TaxID=4577 RepID=A0A1D6FNU9_MAIZE|nr:putative metal-nicotianamine transporter YSL7 [Zea mays]
MDATIGESAPSVERAFEGQPHPGFWGLVTPRSMAVAVVYAFVFSMVSMRIYMIVGLVGAFNMPSNILCFVTLRGLVSLLRRCGIAAAPFTRQENVFLQTSVITCVNVAVASGFATYLVAMTSDLAKSLSESPDKEDVVEDVPMGRYGLLIFFASTLGIMAMIPMVKVMILDYRLLFPTGSVVAHLINSFHTPQGAYVAKLQVRALIKAFAGSISWSIFQWFYTGGDSCGFQVFPTFGLELYKRRFYFDFSASWVGLGMIVPHVVNFGLLFGGCISGGIIYPFLQSKKGQWYHTENPSSLNGINGYKVFMGLTMVVTEGIYNFITLMTVLLLDFYNKKKENDSGVSKYMLKHPSLNYDDRKRLEVFLDNHIPIIGGVVGYIVIGTINTYVTGLTDWSVSTTYCKVVLFIIAAWIAKPGAVIAGLVACGLALISLNVSCQAMQDLRTGYMTLTSPRVVVAGHMYGVLIASVINPLIYLFFKAHARKSGPLGTKNSIYPCPSAAVYRAIALLSTGGVKELPKHCFTFCFITIFLTVTVETVRLVSQRKDWKVQHYIPCMTAIALPFLVGPTFTIDFALGSVVLMLWTKVNRQSAALLSSAVAAGLVCGDGIWYLPSSLLGFFNVDPPICMRFLASGKPAEMADAFLSTLGT